MKKRLVIANWKMYVHSPEAAKKFVQGLKRKASALKGVDVWVAPSFTLLPLIGPLFKGASMRAGAQALSTHESGAHTGEVSAPMLKAASASFSLIGHSERRAAGDTNELVHAQLVAAAGAGLIPVLCVGEVERSTDGTHFNVIEEQLTSALRSAQSLAAKLVVAYEPVWAIGKSAADAMQPADVEEMVIFIRKVLVQALGRSEGLKIPILYGGSVEPANARALITGAGVSGFLVGHASVELDSFVEIVKACKK